MVTLFLPVLLECWAETILKGNNKPKRNKDGLNWERLKRIAIDKKLNKRHVSRYAFRDEAQLCLWWNVARHALLL